MSLTLKQKLQALKYQSGFSHKGVLEDVSDIGDDYDSGKISNKDLNDLFENIFLKRQIEVTLDEIQKIGVSKYQMFDSKIVISNEGMLVNQLIQEMSKNEKSLKLLKENIYKNIPHEWKYQLEVSDVELKDQFLTDITNILKLLIENEAY